LRRCCALTAAITVAALIAGCGSSSNSPALSASVWKQKVNTLCTKMESQSAAVPKPTTPSALPTFESKIIGFGEAEIAQIKALTPPSQFADTQKHIVDDLTQVFSTLKSVIAKNPSGAALAKAAQSLSSQVAAPAKDYVTRTQAAGLTGCIVPGGA
jgi:hypothetical protein